MFDWERRRLLGSTPKRRARAEYNMTTMSMSGRLCRDRGFGGTDYAVLHYLLDIVDYDGYAVATIDHITSETKRSPSGVSAALTKLRKLDVIERAGKSAYRFKRNSLIPQHYWSRHDAS